MQERLFVALELPDDVKSELGSLATGVPGAYPQEEETLHLTLRYLGAVDGARARDLTERLRRLEVAPFVLTLAGLGFFPPRGEPESLWIGVERSEPLENLRARVDQLATRGGIEPDRRRYTPHVTLARLSDAPESRLASFLAGNALFRTRPLEVDRMTLFSSHTRDWGREYQRVEVFLFKGGARGT